MNVSTYGPIRRRPRFRINDHDELQHDNLIVVPRLTLDLLLNNLKPMDCNCSTRITRRREEQEFAAEHDVPWFLIHFKALGDSVSHTESYLGGQQSPASAIHSCVAWLWDLHRAAGHTNDIQPTEDDCWRAISSFIFPELGLGNLM